MKYQVAIIGGNPAGYTAAETVGEAGLSVMPFERPNFGGVCLNEDCIPAKTRLYSAKAYDGARHSFKNAVNVPEVPGGIDKNHVRPGEEVYKCDNLPLCTSSGNLIPSISGIAPLPY